jgi:hypothetical protein
VDAIDWLLDSDPAIRWQAMRDLADAPPNAVAAERARVPHEGVAGQILACQGSDGSWHRAGASDWLPTLFTMIFPTMSLAQRLVGEQLSDGGWNCEAPKSARSSFHTTICVLEGLLEHERAVGSAPEVVAARRRGQEYLLERGLFRRRSTGEVANPAFLKFAFPPRYHYDVLRALDYLRSAGVQPDARLEGALQVVESLQQADGRWILDRAHHETLAFPFSESVGEPSRWNTLRALRVLRWYERAGSPHDQGQCA